MQWPLKHHMWSFCAPIHTSIAIDMFTEPEVCFVAEPNNIKEVFNLQSCSRTIGTSLNVFLMSAGVSLCLSCILYGYSWRSFFKILCNDVRERSSSWKRLRRDFFELLPTESITTSKLSGHLAVNFLPDLGFSAFLLRLFTDSVAHFLWNFAGTVLNDFCLQISSDAKYFPLLYKALW